VIFRAYTLLFLAIVCGVTTVDENGFVTVDPEEAARERLYLERVSEAEACYRDTKGKPDKIQRAIELYETILSETETLLPEIRLDMQLRVAELYGHLAFIECDWLPREKHFEVEPNEDALRKQLAWRRIIGDEAAEMFPEKASRNLLRAAGTCHHLKDWVAYTECMVQARRIARNATATDDEEAKSLDYVRRNSVSGLENMYRRLDPEFVKRICDENQDDPELITAITTVPDDAGLVEDEPATPIDEFVSTALRLAEAALATRESAEAEESAASVDAPATEPPPSPAPVPGPAPAAGNGCSPVFVIGAAAVGLAVIIILFALRRKVLGDT